MTTSLQRTSLGELTYSPLLATSLGELGVGTVPGPDITPSPVYPPGMGYTEAQRKQWIQEEDDLIMAVIMAFLRIKDD
jgi:hypothetical protein